MVCMNGTGLCDNAIITMRTSALDTGNGVRHGTKSGRALDTIMRSGEDGMVGTAHKGGWDIRRVSDRSSKNGISKIIIQSSKAGQPLLLRLYHPPTHTKGRLLLPPPCSSQNLPQSRCNDKQSRASMLEIQNSEPQPKVSPV